MKIRIVTRSSVQLSDVFKVIASHSYKILLNITQYTTPAICNLTLSDDGSFQELIEDIMFVNDVIDVRLVERDLKAEAFEDSLRDRAQYLVDSYPNCTAALRSIDSSHDLDAENLLKIGRYAGKGLVTQGKIKIVQDIHFPRLMKKVVLPVMKSFSISKFKNNELQVLANPLCITKQSDEPSCYLLQGMIQGLLDAATGSLSYSVCETNCKASGSANCIFSISPAQNDF